MTSAISKNTLPAAISTSPGSRYEGSSRTKNSPAVQATTSPVCTPSHSLRRPPASLRCPVTGASSAMNTPATASASPSACDPDSSSAATASVRYTVKTNVTMTALKAADPQSHNAQATTLPREGDPTEPDTSTATRRR